MSCYNSVKSCANIEEQNNIYVFEVILTYNDNITIKHRIICMEKIGELFSAENSIKKIKITLCILNCMETIILKKQFNKDITDIVVLHKNSMKDTKTIVIILNKNDDSNIININYKII